MYHYLYSVQIHIKKPFCLHDFQTFIYQCSRINGNLVPHRPVRVFQCILYTDVCQLFSGSSSERATGCSNQQLAYLLLLFSLHRLEDCTVFAVYRQYGYSHLCSQWHDNMSCCYQSLLIGKCNILTLLNCSNRRSDTDHSYDCRNQNIRFFHLCDLNQSIHARYNSNLHIL